MLGSAENGNGILRLLKALRHESPNVEETARRLGVANGGTYVQTLKTYHTAHGGKLTLGRVLSGSINEGQTLYGGRGQEARIAGVFQLMGSDPKKVPGAKAGDTVALGRLEGIGSGETVSLAKGSTKQLIKIKVNAPVYGLAISVADRKDEVKLTAAVAKLTEEDPSLSLMHNQDTHEMVLWGQGEMHLRVALERLAGKFGVHAQSKPRRISYKETIRKPVSQRGRHKKQSGGHGQFGDVVVTIKPRPRGSGFEFSDEITGGVVPKNYIPSVEIGIRDYLQSGPLGFNVVDVGVCLIDGSYHSVDSSDMAFRQAGRIAMSEGLPQCSPVLLEPVMAVEIAVPSDATAKINGIISSRRGQILGFDARPGWPGWDLVQAQIPEAEIQSLIVDLRSATAGVGTFTAKFDHLAELTGKIADQVLASRAAKAA
jgi:elongation factor G